VLVQARWCAAVAACRHVAAKKSITDGRGMANFASNNRHYAYCATECSYMWARSDVHMIDGAPTVMFDTSVHGPQRLGNDVRTYAQNLLRFDLSQKVVDEELDDNPIPTPQVLARQLIRELSVDSSSFLVLGAVKHERTKGAETVMLRAALASSLWTLDEAIAYGSVSIDLLQESQDRMMMATAWNMASTFIRGMGNSLPHKQDALVGTRGTMMSLHGLPDHLPSGPDGPPPAVSTSTCHQHTTLATDNQHTRFVTKTLESTLQYHFYRLFMMQQYYTSVAFRTRVRYEQAKECYDAVAECANMYETLCTAHGVTSHIDKIGGWSQPIETDLDSTAEPESDAVVDEETVRRASGGGSPDLDRSLFNTTPQSMDTQRSEQYPQGTDTVMNGNTSQRTDRGSEELSLQFQPPVLETGLVTSNLESTDMVSKIYEMALEGVKKTYGMSTPDISPNASPTPPEAEHNKMDETENSGSLSQGFVIQQPETTSLSIDTTCEGVPNLLVCDSADDVTPLQIDTGSEHEITVSAPTTDGLPEIWMEPTEPKFAPPTLVDQIVEGNDKQPNETQTDEATTSTPSPADAARATQAKATEQLLCLDGIAASKAQMKMYSEVASPTAVAEVTEVDTSPADDEMETLTPVNTAPAPTEATQSATPESGVDTSSANTESTSVKTDKDKKKRKKNKK
jgi:hypothetical protein